MSLSRVRKRGLVLLIGIVVLVACYTIVYQRLVAYAAGQHVSIISSLQVVIEALTTAGFGGDTNIWDNSDLITGFVIIMNLTGVIVVFLAIPAVIIPALKPILQVNPSKKSVLTDHVILCGFSGDEDVLIQELEDSDIKYLIISEESEKVIDMEQDGYNSMLGDFEDTETFESANIEEADAVVVNDTHEKTVSTILTVRECSESVKIISVSDTEENSDYHRYAGSDISVNPRESLGNGISNKLTNSITRNVSRELLLNENFEFKELLVKNESRLVGSKISDADIISKIGTTIIGIWKNGVFIPSPKPDTVISSGSVLLTNGDYKSGYGGVKELNSLSNMKEEFNKVAIIGCGVVGGLIKDNLQHRGYETVTVDKNIDSADITKDVTDPEVIEQLSESDIDAVILALNDDETTMFTTVSLSSTMADTFVLARCNDVQNVDKLYSAGADYVLSLSRMTQRMIFANLNGNDEASTNSNYEITVVDEHDFEEVSISEQDIRGQYGYTIIAVERDGEIIEDIDSEFVLNPNDKLVVVEDNQ